MLCGKILSLIEIALHNTYTRAINDKRNYNPKAFLDPAEANWKKTEKIFLEFLDLKEEILLLLQNQKFDENEAEEYLATEDGKEAYNVPELKSPKESTDPDDICFYHDIKEMVLKDIKEYRTHLTSMIRPSGDAQNGYKIFKNQRELYQVLNESRIYQNNRYTDDRIRQFARYIFLKLAKKGDDIMAEKLIEFYEEEETLNEEPPKVEKKPSRKNRKKNKNKNREKKDKSSKQSSQNTQSQGSQRNMGQAAQPQKQKMKAKAVTPQKAKNNGLIEEEKKLADELTATERSSRVDHENDLGESEKLPESHENQSINDAIKDLENISIFMETKSECDKEDEYKLEKELQEDQKAHHDGDKLDPILFTKNKVTEDRIKVSSLSTKECDKIGNAATNSESEGMNYDIKLQNVKDKGKEKELKTHNYNTKKSPKSEINKCISNSSDVVSLVSEEKGLAKIQDSESSITTPKTQNQKKANNENGRNKKQGRNKKNKQNKNKNKKNKRQQNQKQNQKKKEKGKKNNSGAGNGGQSARGPQPKPQTPSPSKSLEEVKQDVQTPNSPTKNSLMNGNLEVENPVRKSKTQDETVEGPPQFFNPKLVGAPAAPGNTLSVNSSPFDSDICQLKKKAKSQIFQGKSIQTPGFKKGLGEENKHEESLGEEETKSATDDGMFNKFQKHANYETGSMPGGPAMQKLSQNMMPGSQEGPQTLGHNLPAYAYPVDSYHSPQPQYNEAYNQMNDPTYRQYIYEIYIYQKISSQIMEETRNITLYSDLIQKYRIGIKKEIESVAVEAFGKYHRNVEAHIYGSVATELALPESDMDVMITGVNSFGSTEAHEGNITEMHRSIKEYFDEEILTSSECILNTQVPIIKMKFNLEKYYEIHERKGDIFVPFINFDSTDASGSSLKELAVDISMSDSYEGAHMGLKQNAFVKEKLEQYPVLRPVCLTLKKLLIANGFNDPYTGGLGSYGLFIMLYAAL